MPTTKKKTKKDYSSDPLSSSGVSSLSGISSYNIRKIMVFKNGDRFHRGLKFVINSRVIKDMEPLLNQINERIELSHGAKKLYTDSGKIVASIKELEDGKIYVAASSQFIPMRYGDIVERVWKPPSRKHSPIFGESRIRTSRTRSQEPRQRKAARSQTDSTVIRSRSVRNLNDERKSRRDMTNGKTASKSPVKKPAPIKKPAPKKPVAPAKSKPPMLVKKKPPVTTNKTTKKGKSVKPPVQTAASQVSTASECPQPTIQSEAAQILEFPEEAKIVDLETIHRTPTPPKTADKEEPKSISAVISARDGDEESASGGEEEEDESGAETKSSGGEESGSGEGEQSVGTDSEVETPSSRKSSSAVSSAESEGDDHTADEDEEESEDEHKNQEGHQK